MNIETGPQLDFAGAMRRRQKVALWTAGLLFLTLNLIIWVLPNEYRSYATLLVEPQAVSDSLVETGAEEIDLNNRLHLMTAQILARSRLSRIIDDLDLYETEHAYMLREDIIDLMRSRIDFVPILPELQQGVSKRQEEVEITTFQLWFADHDKHVAARVAQRLADDFIKEHINERVQQTQKSLEFIEAQLQRLANRMQSVEQQIARVKDENPGRLPEVLFSNHRLLERAVQDERIAQQKLNEARSDVAFWTNQAQLKQEGEVRNDESSGSRQLRMLELELAELQAKGYTENHPDVVKTQLEIENVTISVERKRAEMDAEAQALAAADDEELADEEGYDDLLTEETKILAETYEQATALGEKGRAELRVESALAEIERLQENQYIIQNRIDATPRVAEQLESLEREYAQLMQSLNDFSKRRTEAMVQANLERRQLGEKFRILEPAFPATEVSSPNRWVLLPISLIVSLAIGVVVALAQETLDTSFYSARELQTLANVPVLAAIPKIELEADLEKEQLSRRRSARWAIAAALISFLASFSGYGVMNGFPFMNGQAEQAVEQGEDDAPDFDVQVED